jgi:hypothetical protein
MQRLGEFLDIWEAKLPKQKGFGDAFSTKNKQGKKKKKKH